jgi:Rieske Fe-S protein
MNTLKEWRLEETMEGRREFFGWCGRALAGMTIVGWIAPLLSSCEVSRVIGDNTSTTSEITVSVASLTTDNTALVTQQTGPDNKHILIVRRSASDYLALSMECTHQQCEVGAPSSGIMTCPCHGSQYDLTGAVLQGPASDPLKHYALTYDATATTVTVTLT